MWRKPVFWLPALLIAVIGVSLLPWSPPVEAQGTTLRGPRPVEWKDFLGVNAQFQYFPQPVYEKQMQRLDELGLDWVRLTIHWAMIEPEENQLQLAPLDGVMQAIRAHQFNTLAYLVGSAPFASSVPPGEPTTDLYPPRDFSVFARRMLMLAQRYPNVNVWQVWNEPNIMWLPQADPAEYYRLLTTTAKAIRDVRPEQKVATAGMAYYSQMPKQSGLMLEKMLEQGLAQQNLITAYHPYSQYPEGDTPTDNDFLTRANFLNSALHAKGIAQVWATEWGWSSYNGPQEMQLLIGVDGQSDYTLRRLALMSAMDFQRIFLFNLSDLDSRASPRDQYYGLLDLQGNPKPVYVALQNFFKVTGPRLDPADAPQVEGAPNDLYSIGWTRDDGKRLWMFWSASGDQVQLPGVTRATLYNPHTGTETPLSDATAISVPLRSSLQLLVWTP